MTLLCNGDIDRPIRIEVLDWDKGGKHGFMGQVDTSVRALLDSNGAAIHVIDPRRQAKKGDRYLNDGVLHATYTYIEDNPTFADVSGSNEDVAVVAVLCFRQWLLLYAHLCEPSARIL
jgi:hypothetical protein